MSHSKFIVFKDSVIFLQLALEADATTWRLIKSKIRGIFGTDFSFLNYTLKFIDSYFHWILLTMSKKMQNNKVFQSNTNPLHADRRTGYIVNISGGGRGFYSEVQVEHI